ncbi:MAG: hypothetical protein K8F91_15450 [Candidatus Obscuribacterales bacterium]|nr:hypothetical protein [Candidatus Obscuribacterales bacterium]
MAKHGYRLVAALTLAALPWAVGEAAWAGNANSSNPNMGHFYMARQQIQITDDSPVINYKGGGAPGQAGATAAPSSPVALPRAGFHRFSQNLPSYSNTLPQVNNGVPKAPPPVTQNLNSGMQANAGKIKAAAKKKSSAKSKKPAATTPAKPITVKTHTPYKGYDPATPPKHTVSSHSTTGARTDTKVRGSVLHWARGKGAR